MKKVLFHWCQWLVEERIVLSNWTNKFWTRKSRHLYYFSNKTRKTWKRNMKTIADTPLAIDCIMIYVRALLLICFDHVRNNKAMMRSGPIIFGSTVSVILCFIESTLFWVNNPYKDSADDLQMQSRFPRSFSVLSNVSFIPDKQLF